jgi:hypothetical protein
MTRYTKEVENTMLLFYSGLGEKGRRHFASMEAQKLGRGGKAYISKLLDISQKTLRKGDRELADPELYAQIPTGRQRRVGGGRVFFYPKP